MTTRKQGGTAGHTPTPWRVRLGINEAFIDADDIVCLAVINSLTDTKEAKANAAFIVRACNAHGALVAALTNLVFHADRSMADICPNAIETSKNALKLAEGK